MDSGNSPRLVLFAVAVVAAVATTAAVAVAVAVAPAAVATGGFLRWAFDFFPMLMITITIMDATEDDGFLCSLRLFVFETPSKNVDVFYFSLQNFVLVELVE